MRTVIRSVLGLVVAGFAALGVEATATAGAPLIAAPMFHGSTCEHKTTGSVDIPAVHGVTYTLDGARARAGSHLLPLGGHTVTAKHGHDHASWSFTVVYQNSRACILINPPPRPPGFHLSPPIVPVP